MQNDKTTQQNIGSKKLDAFSLLRAGTTEIIGNEEAWDNYLDKVRPLSESLKNIIFDDSSMGFMIDLGKKFNLSSKNSEDLSVLIREILVGTIFLGKMITTIQSKLNIDQQKAKNIANEIVSNLFAPAIDDIKAIQKRNFPEGGETKIDPVIASQRGYKPPEEVDHDNVLDLRK